MTYEEEAGIAQRVLQQLAGPGARPDVRGGRAQIGGIGYSVHRHGSDLRFNQQTDLGYREVGRYLIVGILEHQGGWMLAYAKRPPGEYHDERAAAAAARLVERTLAQLGYEVGTAGREGRRKTKAELEADVRAFLEQPTAVPIVRRPRRARRS